MIQCSFRKTQNYNMIKIRRYIYYSFTSVRLKLGLSLSHRLYCFLFDSVGFFPEAFQDCFFPLQEQVYATKKCSIPLSANSTKWSNTLKQFVSLYRRTVLSVFDHFVGLVLKTLRPYQTYINGAFL